MQPRGGHLDVGASWDDFYGKNLLPSSILSCWGWRGLAFFYFYRVVFCRDLVITHQGQIHWHIDLVAILYSCVLGWERESRKILEKEIKIWFG